jgi:thioredoxin 1
LAGSVILGAIDTSQFMRNVIEVSDKTLDGSILTSAVPALVDFTAAWCAPCRAIAPHVEAIAAAYGDRLRVATCDTDGNPDLAARYDIRSLPTLLMFKDGQVVGQIVGAVPRARIEALVERAFRT